MLDQMRLCKSKASSANFSAKRMGVDGIITPEDIRLLFEEHSHCVECGSEDNLTVDHIIPLAGNGPNLRTNLQVLCKPCNSSKSSKMPNGTRIRRESWHSRPNRTPVHFRFTTETRGMIEQLAKEQEISLTEVVVRAIRELWKKEHPSR